MKPGKELLFLALGGSGEIGMNVNLYGCDGKWLMVDLGMTFGANEYPGTELAFADLAFIEERRKDLIGIVLTHAHEDHIGALAHLWPALKKPVYARKFTAAIGRLKFEEAGLPLDAIHTLEARPAAVEIGPFTVQFLPMPHSIPESSGLIIDSPAGRILHTGDFKLDLTPVDGRRILLTAVPGEQHSFGLYMVAEFFRRAGWDVVDGWREVVQAARQRLLAQPDLATQLAEAVGRKR